MNLLQPVLECLYSGAGCFSAQIIVGKVVEAGKIWYDFYVVNYEPYLTDKEVKNGRG